ncbi:MAG TPA: tetratricopeptide repeat protein [Armatimonadota bacterium]|nr:tetratricopeptide repeat protein [Armatimonadota bacterium]
MARLSIGRLTLAAWALGASGMGLAGAPAQGAPAPGAPAPVRRRETPPPPVPPPPDAPPGTPGLDRFIYSTDQGIHLFQARVRKNPTDARSYAYLGQFYERKAKETGSLAYYAKAEAALRESLRLFPDNARAAADLAAVLATQHKFAEALSVARKVHQENPRDVDALATMSDALLELGEYAEAETNLGLLAALAPIPPVIARLAHLTELKGDPKEAEELMERAATAARKSGGAKAAAWYGVQLGDIAFNNGRIAEAARRYAAVPKGVDPYHDATFGLGRVRAAQGRYAEALSLYKKAVAIGADPHMLAALGDLYLKLGKAKLAEPLFRQLERETAGKAEYLRERSLFLADHGRNLPEALKLAEQDLAQRKDVFGYDALAWALYKNGRAGEASKAMAEALKLGTRDARLFYHAGMIHGRLGDTEKARDYLGRALALNPHFSLTQAEEARKALAALGGAAKASAGAP